MNIVYKFTFNDRIKNNTPPFYYIGSKSNCQVISNVIIDNSGKKYFGSSRHPLYKDALEHEKNLELTVLAFTDTYPNALLEESKKQKESNVVKSNEFFNLMIAPISSFTSPDYITVKHKEHGKICRIHKNEMDDDWVGVSHGRKWYNNGETSKTFHPSFVPDGWISGRLGDFSNSSKNFLKNTNQSDLSKRMVETRKNNNTYSAWNKDIKGENFHSQNTKQKMANAHKKRTQSQNYTNQMTGKMWINNGIKNSLVNKTDDIPFGYTKGQLKNK